jgi:hypothetical protein
MLYNHLLEADCSPSFFSAEMNFDVLEILVFKNKLLRFVPDTWVLESSHETTLEVVSFPDSKGWPENGLHHNEMPLKEENISPSKTKDR